MIITSLFLIKLITAVLFVLILSLLAEHVSPRASGIISGVPTGTAIILFFYGLEQDATFAAESSVFNLVGMLSMQVFIYLYLRASTKNSKLNILSSSLVAIFGYAVVIFLLDQINFNLFTALMIPVVSIPLFSYLFRGLTSPG